MSVIVPVFNAERHVRETLASIADQTLRNLEVIVVDDGSTDDSVAIIEAFVLGDDRFRLVAGPPHGSAGAARNIGIRLAKGDYLAFLDADDLFAPTMLAKLHAKAVEDHADIVMTAFRSFRDGSGRFEPLGRRGRLHAHLLPKETPFRPKDISDQIFTAPHTTVWNKLFRAGFISRIGLEFEPVRRSNDAYFNMMALAQAESLTYVNEPLVFYRASNESSLQGSQSETDFSWADATRAVARDLKSLGIYGTFQRAMIQRVATRSLDRLQKASTPEAFAEIYETVRYSLFPEFEMDTFEESDFPDLATGHEVIDFIRRPLSEWLHKTPTSIGQRIGTLGTEETVAVLDQVHSADMRHLEHLDVAPSTKVDAFEPPDVSVVVLIGKDSSHVTDCLRSVLSQTGVNLEVISVCEIASDAALEAVHSIAQLDRRLTLVTASPGGESAARNAGDQIASGRYVIHIDSDDLWCGDFLADTVSAADSAHADVVVLDAFSFLDGRAPEPRRFAARGADHEVARPGQSLLSDFRQSRHLQAHVGVLLLNRQYLRTMEVAFDDSHDPQDGLYALTVLAKSTRALRLPLAVYGARVRPDATTSDAARAERAFRSFVALKTACAHIRVSAEYADDLRAIEGASYQRAFAEFSASPRRVRAAMRRGQSSPTARAVYRQMARERAQEASIARK